MQPGGFDFGALMQSAAAMQQHVTDAQASLADERVTGSAGGGLVTAQMDGNGQLMSLAIDRSVVDPDDIETLADLLVAAVRGGARAAESLAQERMSAVTGGMLGALPPGLDLPDISSLGHGGSPGIPGLPGLGG